MKNTKTDKALKKLFVKSNYKKLNSKQKKEIKNSMTIDDVPKAIKKNMQELKNARNKYYNLTGTQRKQFAQNIKFDKDTIKYAKVYIKVRKGFSHGNPRFAEEFPNVRIPNKSIKNGSFQKGVVHEINKWDDFNPKDSKNGIDKHGIPHSGGLLADILDHQGYKGFSNGAKKYLKTINDPFAFGGFKQKPKIRQKKFQTQVVNLVHKRKGHQRKHQQAKQRDNGMSMN